MPQPASISLDIYHLMTRFEGGRPWFQLETWTISVRRNYIETIANSVPAEQKTFACISDQSAFVLCRVTKYGFFYNVFGTQN
jgi:hypothetical protein